MYSCASMSPSQSDPLTVSYMCHCQESGAHVLQRGGNAALRRHRVRAGRENLGDAGGLQPLLGHAERGAQAGAAGAHHHDIEFVVDKCVGLAVRLCCFSHASAPECQFDDRVDRGYADHD